jgi:hypothetical protein
MNASFMKTPTKLAVLSGLLAAMFSFSAGASLLYDSFTYTTGLPAPIPQGGSVLTPAPEIVVSGMAPAITQIEIILTFNDNSSLTGTPTIQGLLDLGTGGSSPSVSFSPSITRAGTGSQEIYDVTFTGTQPAGFNGLNPNNTWGLVLWDTSSSGIENGLVSWTLNVTAVPEPVNVALGVFGVLFVGGIAGRFHLGRRRSTTAG